MSLQHQHIPVQTLHLFPVLDKMLISLLQSLTDEEWRLPTIAKLWTVKDIASHLLDGNLRTLSFSRDKFVGEKAENISSYEDLAAYLNSLNHSWTNATKRLSPQVLTHLLEITGKEYCDHLQTLNPFDPAIFPVAWAGQSESPNWFHIAREYTEKFLHQQQIREATGRQGLMTKELFFPFISTFMFGLPHTYKNIKAAGGTIVKVIVTTEIGGEWNLMKSETGWELHTQSPEVPTATVKIPPGIAWKLFSKGITPEIAMSKIIITGDEELAKAALEMVSVMA